MNQMEPALVSVIIPVYNSAPYLKRCISSLRKQTYENIELIFVDDGSSDQSADILSKAKEEDQRIKVIAQKNEGPSAARNAGINRARGEYIMFCDSDDEAAPDWCKVMVSAIQHHPDALIVCGFYRLDECGNTKRIHTIPEGRYDKSQYYALYLPGLSGSACNKIYRSEIIRTQRLKFEESRKYAEDALFNLSYFRFTKEIFVIQECYYHYYDNESSLSSRTDYFQLRECYIIRLEYIAPQYMEDFKHSFWENAWTKFIEELYGTENSLYMRLKASKRIVKDAVFQELLLRYGNTCLDSRSFALLKHQSVAGFYIVQSLGKTKRALKRFFGRNK